MVYKRLAKIINEINNILLPPVCFGCNARLSGGENLLCTVCRHDLPLTDYNFTEENSVDRLFYGRTQVKKGAAFLYFSKQGITKNLLHFLKYRNQKKIGSYFGAWFGAQIMENENNPFDLVVPVPIHPKKLRKRGYNQVTPFAKQLAQELDVPFAENLLKKTKNIRSQTKKDRALRWQNSQDAFTLGEEPKISPRHILLVDDVITTGATIEACVQALQTLEGVSVSVASLAVVPKG
ncbi:MAG: ComF family protein [Bacteroidota bacterium]